MKNTTKANLSLLLVMLLMLFGPLVLKNMPYAISSILPEYIFILLPCLIIAFFSRDGMVETLKLHTINIKSIVIVILIGIMMRPFIGVISYFASQLFGDQISQFVANETVKLSSIQLLISIALTPAICEEVLLRGVVLNGYRNVSFKKAIILNGLLFGIFHMNLHQFAYTFFIGIIIAASVYITNSIYAGMLIHFVNNGIDVLLVTLSKNSTKEVLDKASTSLNSVTIISMIIFAILSILIVIKLFKLLKKNNSNYIRTLDNNMFLQKERVINWSLILLIIVFLSISILIIYLNNIKI